MLALDDPTSKTSNPTLDAIDLNFLILYTIEMSLKIFGLGFILNKDAYLRDMWNVMDFVIVITSYLPYTLN